MHQNNPELPSSPGVVVAVHAGGGGEKGGGEAGGRRGGGKVIVSHVPHAVHSPVCVE
jgi:hypothetical protein